MSPKSRSSRAAGERQQQRPAAAPAASEALAALQRRSIRVVIFLFVRLVAVAVLVTILTLRHPALRVNRLVLEAAGLLLVVLPTFTAIGRGFAWRIALGRAYVREERWAEAEQTLRVFDRAGYQPFDSTGEGAYWMAVTHRAQGRSEAARGLFDFVARQGRDPWRARASSEDAAAPDAAASAPSTPDR